MIEQTAERKWLKDMRTTNGLSTYDVADKIGISQSLYSSIENGSRNVSVSNAKKIASLFDFNWTQFFD